jgi:hypothetical protein
LERYRMLEPKPTHVRLQSYNNTRSHLAVKLAMVASASESAVIIRSNQEALQLWATSCSHISSELQPY